MSLQSASTESPLGRLIELGRQHQRSVGTILSIFTFYVARTIYTNYQSWYSLGPGGIPHNFLGYLIQCGLRIFASNDIKSTGVYNKMKPNKLESRSFLPDTFPTRQGPPPTVCDYVGPIRQLDVTPNRSLIDECESRLSRIAADNSTHITKASSVMEGGTSGALFISKADADQYSQHLRSARAPREVFHVHRTEGSGHAILSATDAQIVLERGWGERHKLSGQSVGGIPINYVMLYAPRNEYELDLQMSCVKAAVAYGLDGEIHIN